MVAVPVTNDQGVGLGRVDVEHLVVVGETLPGPGKVEQDLLAFVPTDRGQMVGQPVLGERHRRRGAVRWTVTSPIFPRLAKTS